MLALLQNAVSARCKPAQVLATLQRHVAQAPVLRGSRGEAKHMVDPLLQRLGQET
jgi:hypothetical protein